jgi:hypothetical protein
VGEAFLVSSVEPAAWRDFYGGFERMLGVSRTVPMTAAEARTAWRRHRRERPWALPSLLAEVRADRVLRERLFETRELRAARELASAALPESWQRRIKDWLGERAGGGPGPEGGEAPIHPLSPSAIEFFRARTRVRIDKARRLLGYRPAWDLDAGMEMTGRWARWAELAP